ncbi:MAG: trypsin-like peptidase domain-containing protein [Patescibacteria group bacterium]|nr:trypsin-like peptidase domain-containing protein [Patescibacteria group bacterium]
MKKFQQFIIGFLAGIFLFAVFLSGALSDRIYGLRFLDKFLSKNPLETTIAERKVVNEESVVTNVVDKFGPSVVTVGIKKTQQVVDPFQGFFDPFGFFDFPQRSPSPKEQKIEQDIGSGFVVSQDGLVVTNKHVVADTSASYRVFFKDNKLYEVEKIYRDPINDLAILKINPSASSGQVLQPVELGDSSKLKVGQFVIAIGTALGEFRNTVTTGVISGLGRGITAGSPFEGSENLENVIQTDAAINPGNSGGPLLNSSGQVIGVNVAVASGAQNIGFALPINVVKEMLANFNQTGQFSRPYLGVRFRMINQQEAVAKGWVEGAGVVEVVANSPAEQNGLQAGDIITKVNGEKVTDKHPLAEFIAKKKVGDKMELTVWRNDKEIKVTVILKEQE